MHEEALTQEAAEFFPRLAKFKNFYLVGGTALALQIGHRLSVDFDLFSSRPLPPGLLQGVKRACAGFSTALTYRAYEQLNITINGVKTTFFYFPYPLIDKTTPFQGVPLVSVREIAVMKSFSIGKRVSYKDYVDWYFLLKGCHVKLAEVIKLAKKKFGSDFNDRLFLGQLTSLSDVPTQKINFLGDAVDRKTIEKFLKSEVRSFKL